MKVRSTFALVVALAGPAAAGEIVERLVARVNDSVITQTEFDRRLQSSKSDPTAPSGARELRLAILEQMIRQSLVADKAATLGVEVTDAEVDEALERVKSQYGLAKDEDFDRALASNGMTRAAMRAQLHDTILTNKVLSREVQVGLNDDVLRVEYEKVKEKLYGIPDRARVAEIVVRYDPDDAASHDAARAKIAAAAHEIETGVSFADAARKYSEGPTREKGGDLGVVSRGDLTPDLDAAIFGDASRTGPVETRGAEHLFRVTERQRASFRPFDEVKEEIRKKLSEEIYDRKFAEYLRDLRKSSFVKIFDADLAAADKQWQKDKIASTTIEP
jgi:peptidyl-prolyl cis-trans isomerase SurA